MYAPASQPRVSRPPDAIRHRLAVHQLTMDAPDLEFSCGDASCAPLNRLLSGLGMTRGVKAAARRFRRVSLWTPRFLEGKQSAVLDADQTVQEAVLVQVGEGRGRTNPGWRLKTLSSTSTKSASQSAREEPEVLNAAHFVGHEDPKALLGFVNAGTQYPLMPSKLSTSRPPQVSPWMGEVYTDQAPRASCSTR